jgi:hypothetical protein
MVWLAGIVILVLLVASSGFRKFAVGLLVLALVVGALFYLDAQDDDRRSLSRITLSELLIEDLMLVPDHGSYKLTGRIKNRSNTFALSSITFRTSMKDCVSDPLTTTCVVIAEGSTSPYLDIPSGQARDFERTVYFSGDPISPRGRLEWDYEVSEIRAR